MQEKQGKWLLLLLQFLLGLAIFSWLIPQVDALPQDAFTESFSDETTAKYDDMGMRIRTKAPNHVEISSNEEGNKFDEENKVNDPFKPKTGHVPGGLPMISDSVFSLTILIYVSVAFLVVFFLFCWKTNGNGSGNPEDLKQQCPLMTNNPPEPNVIPPTPTFDSKMKDSSA